MSKEDLSQVEKSKLLTDSYRIFFDADDYSPDVLIGYCRLLKKVWGKETDSMVCNIVLHQLIKACKAFKEDTFFILTCLFGLDGNEPLSDADIAKSIFLSQSQVNNLCSKALKKLGQTILASKYNISIRKQHLTLPKTKIQYEHIEAIGLSVRTYNVLCCRGIVTVQQFLNLSIDEMKKFRYFGEKCIDEVLEKQKSITENLNDI